MTTGRWSTKDAVMWAARRSWPVGCNFTPSTACNQLEMWQPETFDPATIDRELSWASGLGMNTVRVYLHDIAHRQDSRGFLDRVEWLLDCADGHGISVVPVLFDGVWNPHPRAGAQKEPIPRLHNSRWVQGPGAEILYAPQRWAELQPYVVDLLTRFAGDRRVLAWDLFNEPDQVDGHVLSGGSREEKASHASALAREVFAWAREVSPSQPLTVGIWEYDDNGAPAPGPFNELAVELSDIISFHCYLPGPGLRSVIDNLVSHDRPLLCTEWLARTAGSTVDLLHVFDQHNVGAVNWGLVDGRTNTRYPWSSWTQEVTDDEPWFHELLHADGTPYDIDEAELFRRVTGARQSAWSALP
jgi:hypothetical protein